MPKQRYTLDKKKSVDILAAIAVMVIAVYFCVVNPGAFDKRILLERTHPYYWDYLRDGYELYVSKENIYSLKNLFSTWFDEYEKNGVKLKWDGRRIVLNGKNDGGDMFVQLTPNHVRYKTGEYSITIEEEKAPKGLSLVPYETVEGENRILPKDLNSKGYRIDNEIDALKIYLAINTGCIFDEEYIKPEMIPLVNESPTILVNTVEEIEEQNKKALYIYIPYVKYCEMRTVDKRIFLNSLNYLFTHYDSVLIRISDYYDIQFEKNKNKIIGEYGHTDRYFIDIKIGEVKIGGKEGIEFIPNGE